MYTRPQSKKRLYETISLYYAEHLYKKGIISKEEIEIHKYGMISILSTIVTFAILFVLSLLIHDFIGTVAFCIVFSIIRSHYGGWHAKTPLHCTLATIAIWLTSYGMGIIGERYCIPFAIACFVCIISLLWYDRKNIRKEVIKGICILFASLLIIAGFYFIGPLAGYQGESAVILAVILRFM